MKKEISVSNFYYKDDNIWNNIKQRLSGTYMLTQEELDELYAHDDTEEYWKR